MNTLIKELVLLPNMVIYGVLGAIGGSIGGALSVLATHTSASKGKLSVPVLIFAGLATSQVSRQLIPPLKEEAELDSLIDGLKEQRIFNVLFRIHPEAEIEMRNAMGPIGSSLSGEEAFERAQTASAEVVNKYYGAHILTASDESIHGLLQANEAALRKFQEKPELCVGFYIGTPRFQPGDIDDAFMKQMSDVKADVIESSAKNPSVFDRSDAKAIFKALNSSYKGHHYSIEGLAKIDEVATLPPGEGCRIATEFSSALASMPAKQGSFVFKNLMYDSLP